MNDITFLKNKAQWVRQTVLEMSVAANSGHITSAFSQTELVVALYYADILKFNPNDPKWVDRDRFILSKGQGGIGIYPILADLGYFSKEELINFTKPGNFLGVHAEYHAPGIELLTGSLGHGLPITTGLALDAKLKGKNHKFIVLLGDGELFEGSNWESLFFLSHYNLNNIICVVDRNKQSTLGFHDSESEFCDKQYHKDGPCLNPLDKKWEAFGFNVRTIQDGHDFNQILDAFKDFRTYNDKPLVIISKTSKGRGTSITENQRLWHYRYPQGLDLDIMRKELAMGLEEFDKVKQIKREHIYQMMEDIDMNTTKFIIGMRDAYFDELYKIFQKDKSSIFITADNGAPTLDKMALDFPDQYYQVGIAEQQMMGMAAGLALEGRKVYTYAIAPFVTLRIAEFIKLNQGVMNLPIVNIGIGAGYSYDIMGPTHHTVEDITCMRVFPNLKIYSPCDGEISRALVNPIHTDPSPAYIRFDRASIPIYNSNDMTEENINNGLICTSTGKNNKCAILTTGRFVHNSLEISKILQENYNIGIDVIDIFRLKPINTDLLLRLTKKYSSIVTYEEHFLAGGLGSLILEILNDNNAYIPTLRIGQGEKFVFDMGGREHLWKLYKMDPETVANRISTWLKG